MASQDSIETLVARAREGDRGAFERLVAQHQDRLLASIRARGRHHETPTMDPEDVLAETLLRAFESIASFEWKGPDSFLRWLFGISRHIQIDVARRERTIISLEAAEAALASAPTASRAFRREERFERLAKAINELPTEYRKVIRLARIEGLKSREIALRIGKSDEAVRHLLSRGLKCLRKALGETHSLHLPDRELPWEGDRHG